MLEVDEYPALATVRPKPEDGLCLGNAIVSIVVEDLDELDLQDAIQSDALGIVNSDASLLYQGARTAVIQGDAGELIELIEYPKS